MLTQMAGTQASFARWPSPVTVVQAQPFWHRLVSPAASASLTVGTRAMRASSGHGDLPHLGLATDLTHYAFRASTRTCFSCGPAGGVRSGPGGSVSGKRAGSDGDGAAPREPWCSHQQLHGLLTADSSGGSAPAPWRHRLPQMADQNMRRSCARAARTWEPAAVTEIASTRSNPLRSCSRWRRTDLGVSPRWLGTGALSPVIRWRRSRGGRDRGRRSTRSSARPQLVMAFTLAFGGG